MRFARTALGVLFATLAVGLASASAEEGAQQPARPAIPFKTEPTPIEEHGPRLLIVLTALAAISLAGLYLVRKRLPAWRPLAPSGKRLQVVERARLNPRCTLFVVRLDEREILVGQCGDTLVRLDPPAAGPKEA